MVVPTRWSSRRISRGSSTTRSSGARRAAPASTFVTRNVSVRPRAMGAGYRERAPCRRGPTPAPGLQVSGGSVPEYVRSMHRLAARMDAIEPFRVVEVMEAAWELEAAGRSIVWLVAGEPDFGTPAAVVDAAARAAAHGHVHYTASLGIPALRHAISSYDAERFGVVVPADRVAVTTGA